MRKYDARIDQIKFFRRLGIIIWTIELWKTLIDTKPIRNRLATVILVVLLLLHHQKYEMYIVEYTQAGYNIVAHLWLGYGHRPQRPIAAVPGSPAAVYVRRLSGLYPYTWRLPLIEGRFLRQSNSCSDTVCSSARRVVRKKGEKNSID